MWFQLIILVVSFILSAALRPKPQNPAPAGINDVSIPQIEIGKPLAVAFGEVWIDDSNIVWYGDMANQPIYSDGGKK